MKNLCIVNWRRQMANFSLNKNFVKKYRSIPPKFGFNGLGETVYRRTYSRLKPDGSNEKWYETCERVVNGTYRMQERHIKEQKLGWNPQRAQDSAQEMFSRIFSMKFLPPGRGLFAMGATVTEERGLMASLFNCGFCSTENLKTEKSNPFCFLMDMSMLGVGIGFDTTGRDTLTLHSPAGEPLHHVVADSREGWVESLRLVLESYFNPGMQPLKFDYSLVRPQGTRIHGFGGLASGPGPLKELHEFIKYSLGPTAKVEGKMSLTQIVDIFNFIGKSVIAGSSRRSAEIAFGAPGDDEFLDLKNPEMHAEELRSYRWCSNNTVFADIGMDYSNVADRTRRNGEPGYAWLKNMQAFSRMADPADWKDKEAKGGNPCLEQTLFDKEMCCLVEVFPEAHTDYWDFQRSLKFSYLYAKTVTLSKVHWPETNRVMLKNRRIGNSLSGIVQFVRSRGLNTLKEWCEQGVKYIDKIDKKYSDWLAIPLSIKTTSVKPSGSVSKLPGATSGIHWPISQYCKVRVRVAKNHHILEDLKDAGYYMEECIYNSGDMAVSFPVDHGEGLRGESDVSCWEKISLAAFMQKYWASNQVSATITFDPESEGQQIEKMLDYFQYQLKGVSFLPMGGVYKQMSYEPLTKQEYWDMRSEIRPIIWSSSADAKAERFCDNDVCQL